MRKLLLLGVLLMSICMAVIANTAVDEAQSDAQTPAAETAQAQIQAAEGETQELEFQPTAEPSAAAESSATVDSSAESQTQEVADVSLLTTSCAACHGGDGNSGVPAYPKLAGQNAAYLLKQMQDIKSGKRDVPVMIGQLDSFEVPELKAIARHYQDQERTLNQAQKPDLELGEKIYRIGNAETGVPACTGCHSPTGQGNALAGFPALGGQHADYIVLSLKAFKEGAQYPDQGRRNDELQGVMRDIALRMSDREIQAVANYASGLY